MDTVTVRKFRLICYWNYRWVLRVLRRVLLGFFRSFKEKEEEEEKKVEVQLGPCLCTLRVSNKAAGRIKHYVLEMSCCGFHLRLWKYRSLQGNFISSKSWRVFLTFSSSVSLKASLNTAEWDRTIARSKNANEEDTSISWNLGASSRKHVWWTGQRTLETKLIPSATLDRCTTLFVDSAAVEITPTATSRDSTILASASQLVNTRSPHVHRLQTYKLNLDKADLNI